MLVFRKQATGLVYLRRETGYLTIERMCMKNRI